MKNLSKALFLCGLLFLYSCSVLKKSKESHASSNTEVLQGSQSSTAAVDTSRKTTTEHWRLTFPGSVLPGAFTSKGNLPKFERSPVITLPGATKEQAAAVSDLQSKYNKLLDAYNDQGKAIDQSEAFGQGLLLELDRKIDEHNGKSVTGNQQDSLKVKTGTQLDNKESSKEVNWRWVVGGLCVVITALFIVYRFVKWQP